MRLTAKRRRTEVFIFQGRDGALRRPDAAARRPYRAGASFALRFETNWVEMKRSEARPRGWPFITAIHWFMRSRATSFLSVSLIWLLPFSGNARAQEPQPTEYQIKAAFLFNFAKFVEWPPTAFAGATSPIVIGILGENPFKDDLAGMIRNKTVDGRPLVVKQFGSATEATNCHILFISTSEKDKLPEILKGLKETSVLTVGEMDHFTESGGMIRFVLKEQKIRFQINNGEATRAKLKISSKLMSLALPPGG